MRKRIDELLFENGYFYSRSRAKEEILSGNIEVDGKICSKAGMVVDGNVKISIKEKNPYVSRGAYKLLKAVGEFSIDLSGKVCCDLGASTGGFTQVMLEKGAICVYAVDVGHGDFRIKDPRVILKEKTNARFLKKDDFDQEIDFISCDLSFISLKLILPVLREILSFNGRAVCLIKPQFEVGAGKIGNGIVRSTELHIEVIEEIVKFAKDMGFEIGGLTFSPIKGSSGNIEFLIELNHFESKKLDVLEVVNSSWIELEGRKDVHH